MVHSFPLCWSTCWFWARKRRKKKIGGNQNLFMIHDFLFSSRLNMVIDLEVRPIVPEFFFALEDEFIWLWFLAYGETSRLLAWLCLWNFFCELVIVQGVFFFKIVLACVWTIDWRLHILFIYAHRRYIGNLIWFPVECAHCLHDAGALLDVLFWSFKSEKILIYSILVLEIFFWWKCHVTKSWRQSFLCWTAQTLLHAC